MTTPNVPTDNLYRFVALTALLGVLACVVLSTQLQYRLQGMLFQHDAEMAVTNAGLPDAKETAAESGQTDSRDSAVRDRLSDVARRTALLNVQRGEVATLEKEMRKIWIGGRLASFALLVVAGWGFKRWYKLQQMQDELLAAEVAKLKSPGRANQA